MAALAVGASTVAPTPTAGLALEWPSVASLGPEASVTFPRHPGSSAGLSSPDLPYVPGELIVRFHDETRPDGRAAILRAEGASLDRDLALPGLALVRLPVGTDVKEAVAAFERRPDVLYAEPNWIHGIAAIPDDPRFGELWGLHQTSDADIDGPAAWDITTGSTAVIVAVVDTGVAYDHPDLAPNLWTNDDLPGGGDDDGNGFVDDTHGWDFVQDDNTPLDYNGHGTHVAGTVGARGNNGRGVVGVNWQVSIMPIRAADGSGAFTVAAIVDAFEYACANGADIVNGSFGGDTMSTAIADAVLACPDVLFVFAAGNEGKDLDGTGTANDSFPCELHLPPTSAPNVVCVAATGIDDTLASFSNHGSEAVHLAAPGVGILSAWPAYEVLPDFPDGFEGTDGEFDARWGDRTSTAGDALWDRTSAVANGGSFSLTDSPGGDYADDSATTIRRIASIDLTGRLGCAVDYDLRLDTEPDFDFFTVRAGTTTSATTTIAAWSGSTGGAFFRLTSDLSSFDGQPTVYLRFGLVSDESVTDDGAYVDNVAVKCLVPDGEDYLAISGTSMATPHVAGAVALLLAQDGTRTVSDLKTLLLNGVDVLPSLADLTITEGRLNACTSLGGTATDCSPDSDPPETTIDSGPSGLTNDPTPTFEFSSDEPGSTFECRVDAAVFASCTSPHTTAVLEDGPHTFEVRAIDSSGNVDPSAATRSFTVDTEAPGTTIDSGPSGPTDDPTPTFAFSSDDPSALFECRVDAAAFAACVSPHTTSVLGDGSHTFEARAVDPAGNVGPAASRSFLVDTVAPSLVVSEPASGQALRGDVTVRWSAEDVGSGIVRIELSLDGGPVSVLEATATTHTFVDLAEGSHSVSVRVVDGVGRTREVVVGFLVDNTPPVLSVVAPGSDAEIAGRTVEVEWTASDAVSGIDQIEILLDGGDAVALGPDARRHAFTGLLDGSHILEIRVLDAAGNEARATLTFYVRGGGFATSESVAALVGLAALIAAIGVVAILLGRRRRRAPPGADGPR